MKIRSYDELDFPLAWKRTLRWAREGGAAVADRLPFEVVARLYESRGPVVLRDHQVQPVTLVISPKKSETSRPLARLRPVDLTLYQALLDKLAVGIEAALPPRDVVFAYRQTTGKQHDAFHGTPSRAAYEAQTQEILTFHWDVGYALTADIAGYFLHIDIDELERLLLSVSAETDVVRDLSEILGLWRAQGLRGLPQGVRPSSPLGNLYLQPLDRLLAARDVAYVSWMDDLIIGVPGFHDARRIQDEMERCLYDIGLTLAADKTRILRWEAAAQESRGAQTQLDARKQARREAAEQWINDALAWADYPPTEDELPKPEDMDREAVVEQYEELLQRSESDEPLPKQFHSLAMAVLRDLEALDHPYELPRLPQLLVRAPSLTRPALRYLSHVARHNLTEATEVFRELLATDRFMLDVEKLDLCLSILALEERRATALADDLGRWALEDDHDLVRARALLAWGAQSRADDFNVADAFWMRATSAWRPYVLIAIQSKSKDRRNARYDRWSGEGRFSEALVKEIKRGTFAWRKL